MFRQLIFLLSPVLKFKIQGTSMEPTIKAGESVLVNRTGFVFQAPQKGDLVALHDPRDGKILIKRITKKSGKKFFVEGDNKAASTDSRVFGWIEKRDIIGKVVL